MSQKTKWNAGQQNKSVLLLMGLVLLGLSYGAISWAIDSGRWLAYSIAAFALIFGMRSIFRVTKLYIRN